MEVISLTLQLTQKERMLLEDQKSHEQLCIQKYKNYAQQANDPQLKQLFNTYASQEQQHLDTVNQILNGQIPQVGQGQGQGSQGQQQNQTSQNTQQMNQQTQASGQTQSSNAGMTDNNDYNLCNDVLATEKYVSSTYNTTIFECTNSQVRQALNHIQKEEQQHGEGIFNYMRNQGMYSPK